MSNEITPEELAKLEEKAANDAKAGIIGEGSQLAFLQSHLTAFSAFCNTLDNKATGVRKTGGVKGQKQGWVTANVWPEFTRKYGVDGKGGAPLETVRKKLTKWFNNHRSKTIPASGKVEASSSKPRATTAIEIFGKDNAQAINKQVNEIRKSTGQTTQQANLEAYRKVRESMYNALDNKKIEEYKMRAEAENEKRKRKPEPDHIFKNQTLLADNTMSALRKLGGDDWDQHGNVVFFVQAAYKDERDRWQTITTTVATPGMKRADFREYLGEEVYQSTYRPSFRKFLDHSYPDVVAAAPVAKPSTPVVLNASGDPPPPASNEDSGEESDILELPDPQLSRRKSKQKVPVAPQHSKTGSRSQAASAQQEMSKSPSVIDFSPFVDDDANRKTQRRASPPSRPLSHSKSPSPVDFSPPLPNLGRSKPIAAGSPPQSVSQRSLSLLGFSDDEEWGGIEDLMTPPSPVGEPSATSPIPINRSTSPPPARPQRAIKRKASEALVSNTRKRQSPFLDQKDRLPTGSTSKQTPARQPSKKKAHSKTVTTQSAVLTTVAEGPRRSSRGRATASNSLPSGEDVTQATYMGTGTWKSYQLVTGPPKNALPPTPPL